MKNYKAGIVGMLLVTLAFVALPVSQAAAATPVNLGTAAPFAVLAYSGITNTGTTTITGNVGSYPTPAETGFSTVTITGTNYPAGAPASTQTDLAAVIVQAKGYAPATILTALDTQTLVAGVYTSASTALTLSGGVLTLNGAGVTTGIWIFQAPDAIAGALSTTGGSIVLKDGADSCNVFWVTSAGGATIGSGTAFVGTIMAYSSVTLGTSATLQGAALANTGDVTMQGNTISTSCITAPITTTSSTTSTTTTTPTTTSSTTSTTTTTSPTSTTTTSTTSTTPTSTTATSTQQATTCAYASGYYTNSTTSKIVYFYSIPWATAIQLVDNNGPGGISCASPPTTTTTTSPSCVYLTVVSETSNGTILTGESNDIWNSQSQTLPTTTCVPPNTVETVGVFDTGHYIFSHWLDTGSALRFRTFSIASNTTLTAIYTNTNVPILPTESVISVSTVSSSNVPIGGIYTTLWQNGVLAQSCFSSCQFVVSNGQTYQVAVADWGSYLFNHWASGSTDRFCTVVVGNTASTISEVSVYGVGASGAPKSPTLAQVMAIQSLPETVHPVHSSLVVTVIEVGAIVAVLASLIGFGSLRRRSSLQTPPTR